MVEILAMATEISAVTSGLIQAVKQTNLIKKEYLPLTLPHSCLKVYLQYFLTPCL